ncbi:MAG: M16 family metallopeptidase [Candidatus Kariarchaeaceae archaeon]
MIISRSNLRTVSFGISLTTGSAYEPIPGLTDVMTTHMLRNTGKYNEKEFADLVDNYGIRIFSDVDRTNSSMGFKVPPQHLKKALEIFKEIWSNPEFLEDTTDRIVKQQIGALQEIKSTPEDIVTNYTKWEVAYDNDPITRHPFGTLDGIEKINPEELNSWYRKMIQNKPYFASVGLDINESLYSEYGLADIMSIFGSKISDKIPITDPKKELNIRVDTPEMPSSNSYIGVNLRGSDPASNKYFEDLYRSVIGGGMSARMFTEIREKRNLSYAPRFSGERFAGGSLYTALMDVRPDRAVEALETTVNLLYDGLTKPVEKEEMQRALKVAQRIAVFVSDSSSGYTNFILDRLASNREFDLDKIKDQLTDTSKSEWQNEVLNRWTKENISLAVSGETGQLPEMWDKIIGKVF